MTIRDYLGAVFGAAALALMLAWAIPKDCDPSWYCLYLWICLCGPLA